jgi:hypothetical protein
LLAGAVNATVAAVADVAVADPIVGAPGALHVVALLLAELGTLGPYALVAITLNVYAVPVDNPVTTTGEAEFEALKAPQLVNAVYAEIAPPPVSEGAVNATETEVPPTVVAVPMVGALETFKGSYPGRIIPAV